MSFCDIKKNERIISIFENFMTKFHELPEQPSYISDLVKIQYSYFFYFKRGRCFHSDSVNACAFSGIGLLQFARTCIIYFHF